MVLKQTTLGQISIAPWTDQLPPREKNKLNSKQATEKKKRPGAKRAGCPER
jgi:hypothetical protein